MLLRTVLVLLLLAPASPAQSPEPLLVCAAISLTDALQEIAGAYEASGGAKVRFSFAGSNVLARQINNGAPADVFISADLVQMHHVEKAGAIQPGRFSYLLSNQLVVIVPSGRTLPDGGARALAQPAIRRIAIADPAAVPAGFYARKFLQHEGLWEALQPRLVPLANVRAALAAVEKGGADAGIVYESDTATARHVSVAYRVPSRMTGPIVYPVAVLDRSKNKPQAEAFVSFLRGDRARAVFEKYKFIPYRVTH